MEMLRQVLDATQANVLSVSSAVHSEYVVTLFLLQRKVQLVGGELDERLLLLDRRLHLHIHHLRPGCSRSEGEFEVVGLAALPALVAPQDMGGAPGDAAVSPVTQEGVDQLLAPLADCRHVHRVVG